MKTEHTPHLRYAIIGIGAGIMNSHRPALTLPGIELVAATDINVSLGQQRADELHCAFYEDYRPMLAEARPDVVVILTPPFLHASMTKDCLQAGCHVLIEKPMAISIGEADEMINTARETRRLLGVIFQQRYRPEILAARKLLQEGFLGEIQRVELTAVWTRPTSYYEMAPWRATWMGEGGGILTNQSSHNLDHLCHLLGSPKRVVAWTRRLLHQIETEDTVHAMLEWPDGALGLVHISTAEADEPERLKIIGTRGSLKITRGSLQVQTLDIDLREYAVTALNPYAPVDRRPYAITLEQGKGDHVAVYRSFYNAVCQQDSDYCDGVQGRMELELANAMLYSDYHGEVELPLDSQRYATLLKELQENSRYRTPE